MLLSAMPALLTSTSGAPCSDSTESSAALIAAPSRTSTLKNVTGSPVFPCSSAADSSPSSWFASKITSALAPASAHARAMWLPSPRAPLHVHVSVSLRFFGYTYYRD